MESNPVPRICSKIFRIPLYLEVNDLIPLVLKENKSFSKRILRASKCQKLDLVHSAGLIVPSVPMCNWLIKEYMLPRDKVHLILNGADKPINNKLSKKEARKKLGISSNCFCLVFVGNIYPGYDFKTILEAVTECKKNILHIRLIIIGNGPLLDKVKNDTSIMEMNGTVIFTGYIPEERLGKILPAADAGLLLRTKKGALRYGPISTKLSTYFAYNLPVVTAGWSLKDYPNEFVQGIYLIPPENASALAGKILHIYNNPKESIKRAKMLNKFALENLTWNVVADHILNVIQQDLK
jgi:glycosyltransferase involved in cell wall biosynthesis